MTGVREAGPCGPSRAYVELGASVLSIGCGSVSTSFFLRTRARDATVRVNNPVENMVSIFLPPLAGGVIPSTAKIGFKLMRLRRAAAAPPRPGCGALGVTCTGRPGCACSECANWSKWSRAIARPRPVGPRAAGPRRPSPPARVRRAQE